MTIELVYSWRTRLRIAGAIAAVFAAGVVAATSGASVYARLPAAAVFLVGAGVLVDAIVLAASWRMTPSALKIPDLVNRRREIVGRDGLAVSFEGRWTGTIVVAGPKGSRRLRTNPLVSTHDLRRWFGAMADDI